MLQSDLPVCITGDASLAEAISMRKLFLYDSQPWKREVIPALAEFAQKDATPNEKWIFASIFGFISGYYTDMNNEFIGQVGQFFSTHFSLVCEAMEDYRKGKYSSSQEALLSHLTQTQRLTDLSEQVVMRASEYLFFSYMDSLYYTQGKIQFRDRIMICDGIPQYAYANLLVSDVQYRTTMYQLFDKIHRERDLARNMSKVIEEGIRKYCG